MSQGANVRSVDAIKCFKVALINYAEEARNALSSAEMEIRQVRNWLERDQLTYWQSQVKRNQEKLAMARTELNRRRLSQANSDAISDSEQKEAVREGQRRLREAEEKIELIKRWIPVLEHAVSEYHSQSQPLGDRLSGRFVATVNVLDRMINTLDAYLAMSPPTAPSVAPPRASTSDGPGQASTAGSSSSETQSEVKRPDEVQAAPQGAPVVDHSIVEGAPTSQTSGATQATQAEDRP